MLQVVFCFPYLLDVWHPLTFWSRNASSGSSACPSLFCSSHSSTPSCADLEIGFAQISYPAPYALFAYEYKVVVNHTALLPIRLPTFLCRLSLVVPNGVQYVIKVQHGEVPCSKQCFVLAGTGVVSTIPSYLGTFSQAATHVMRLEASSTKALANSLKESSLTLLPSVLKSAEWSAEFPVFVFT